MKEKGLHFVGIDISKETFDAAMIVSSDKENIRTGYFPQDKDGFKRLLTWVKQNVGEEFKNTVYCMEHTGIYNIALMEFLCDQNLSVCLESGKQIKLSMGLQRGKNDKIDARRIALYALKNEDDLRQWHAPRKEMKALKALLTQRNMLLQTKVNLEQNINELKSIGLKEQVKLLSKYNKGIKGIAKDIEQIEADINTLIKTDESLNKMFKQITGVPGIGSITAIHLIVYTNEFKTVRGGKQLACHCGVVPFEYTSGKSIKGKPRVHHAANKTLKTLLHMCALAAIRMEGEFKKYYERKIAEGKHKMSVLNAIRNKLILRVAAIIKNDITYVENYVYSV
jgi:transposase